MIIFIVIILVASCVGLIVFVLKLGNPASSPQGLVEEEIQQPRIDPIPNDRDRDGLTNEEEDALGTSQVEFDTDRDGLADYDEIYVWKTDPKNPDSDGDGFGDGIEVVRGFNPAGVGKLK